MICYTRNFEDVILQRVFTDVPKGHYIDVGASNPINDSNTYALYQKGWRGVAIEPQPLKEYWQSARPEDVFLNAAVGAQEGTLTLQVYDQVQQLSSGSPDTLVHWQNRGVQPNRSIEVTMLTLDQIIAEYLTNRPLQLLSIDVEGMEYQVLKGLNLRLHRPWVIVIEAVLPGCPIPCHQAWESHLLEAGYILAYFDGVNRFYLAQEQRSVLGRFALPPNVWDGFEMVKQIELEAQVAQLTAQVAKLQADLSAHRAK